MDVTNGIPVPLSDDLQSPLSNILFNSFLLFNKYPNEYFNEHNNNMDYFDDELNSDTIEAFQPFFDRLSSFTYN